MHTLRTALVLFLALLAAGAVQAFEDIALQVDMHEGKVVTALEGKLTIIKKDGDNAAFAVSAEAKITRNQKPIALEELKEGDLVKVAVKREGNKEIAIAIDARSPE